MSEPDIARDYQERDVKAVYSVLIELGQVLGAWREKFVIVGGAVPWLLLGEARPKHIGTLDIDLDLNPDALAEGEYATLVEALEKKGYERGKAGLKPFQLRRWVKVDKGFLLTRAWVNQALDTKRVNNEHGLSHRTLVRREAPLE